MKYPIKIAASFLILLSLIQTKPSHAEGLNINLQSESLLLSESIPTPTSPAGPWNRISVKVEPCQNSPKIDGILDDACWKTATHAQGFYRSGGTLPIENQTEAWLCTDKDHLYVAFHCIDNQPQLIKSSETQRDSGGIWSDDIVYLDIDSQGRHRSNSSFVVNARGTQTAYLEGGTADNITWAGNWKAGARRVKDGWVAEISIPFALMRYPKGTTSFGLGLFRHISRETSDQTWPYLPREGWENDYRLETQYLNEITGINPPFYAPHPVVLPYVLAYNGENGAVRQGMDIKYPLSTSVTSLATIHPDFQTIEQDVTDVSFSYTEKYMSDRRPFFAEGRGYFPYQDLFYSRRVQDIDSGVKVISKQNGTSAGFLGTINQGGNSDSNFAMAMMHDIGDLNRLELDFVGNNQRDLPSNRVGKIQAEYGWMQGHTVMRQWRCIFPVG